MVFARKLINQTNMLKNIEHRIKKHTKALVPPKTHQLATIKRELQNTNTKKLNQEAKVKNKPINYILKKITKLTKLFSPIQITNED
jgi:hypothetical protein